MRKIDILLDDLSLKDQYIVYVCYNTHCVSLILSVKILLVLRIMLLFLKLSLSLLNLIYTTCTFLFKKLRENPKLLNYFISDTLIDMKMTKV